MHYAIAVTVPAGENTDAWISEVLPEHEGKCWDWYAIGGRWDGYWTTKSGEKTNGTWVSEIDWEGMVAEQIAKAGKAYDSYDEFLDRENYTRDEYIKLFRNVAPYGWITKENDWIDRWGDGEKEISLMVWEKEFRKYIQSLNPDDILVLVDFHN